MKEQSGTDQNGVQGIRKNKLNSYIEINGVGVK